MVLVRNAPANRRRLNHPRLTDTVPGRARPRPPGSTGRTTTRVLAAVLLGLLAAALGWRALDASLEAARGVLFAQAPVRVASAPPAARPDPALVSRLQAATTMPRGSASVVVRDLATGASADVAGERVLPSASLFKLPILVETLKQVRLRRLSLDDQLEITPDEWTDGSGVLQARVGDKLPVRELLRLMIQQSDNIAALVLLDAVGIDNVNATMQAMGLTATRLHDRRSGDMALHETSARDMERLLEAVATGQLIDAETSQQALGLLELKQANTWLGEQLPWWVRVAHKWGDLEGYRHDAGIVFTPQGNYVVVVMTQGGTPQQAQAAIAAASKVAYEQLAAH